MIERATATENGNGPVAIPVAAEPPSALEGRVRRLEDAVAVLQDTRQIEERVVERLTHSPDPSRHSADLLLNAGRHLLPAAVSVIQGDAAPTATPVPAGAQAGRPWLLWDIWVEARAMLHMFVDPRYRMTWWGRLVPLALLAAIITSWLWVPGAWFLYESLSKAVAIILVKLVDLVLAYFLFKVLAAEARRYRETAPALPPHLRG